MGFETEEVRAYIGCTCYNSNQEHGISQILGVRRMNDLAFSYKGQPKRAKIGMALGVVAVALTCVAIATYLSQMKDGYEANLHAKRLLQLAQNTSVPGRVLQDVEGFSIIAKLDIPAIGQSLPVIGECTKKSLSYSVCRLSGPVKPGQAGHLVIMGHAFRDGSHFGRIDRLKIGDPIMLTDSYGNVYYYEVYEIVSMRADDSRALTVYYGERGLTLLTTADSTNRSMLVRCKEKAQQ